MKDTVEISKKSLKLLLHYVNVKDIESLQELLPVMLPEEVIAAGALDQAFESLYKACEEEDYLCVKSLLGKGTPLTGCVNGIEIDLLAKFKTKAKIHYFLQEASKIYNLGNCTIATEPAKVPEDMYEVFLGFTNMRLKKHLPKAKVEASSDKHSYILCLPADPKSTEDKGGEITRDKIAINLVDGYEESVETEAMGDAYLAIKQLYDM